jgi:hypothetical protein
MPYSNPNDPRRQAALKRYNDSAKGAKCRERYEKSDKGKKYLTSNKRVQIRRRSVTEYNHRLRAAALDFLGNRCVQCGFTDARALQIDHIHGGGARERREGKSPRDIYRKVLAGEPGYQLLCANCNWIKRYENEEHGGRS